jgi:hypothetical protein
MTFKNSSGGGGKQVIESNTKKTRKGANRQKMAEKKAYSNSCAKLKPKPSPG